MPNPTYELNKVEAALIAGLRARERDIINDLIDPLRQAYQSVLNDAEERLGLEQGTLLRDYELNFDTWTLHARAVPTPAPVSDEEMV